MTDTTTAILNPARQAYEESLLASIRTTMEKYGFQCRDMADEIVLAAWEAHQDLIIKIASATHEKPGSPTITEAQKVAISFYMANPVAAEYDLRQRLAAKSE